MSDTKQEAEGDLAAPTVVENTPTVSAKRPAEDENTEESKKARVEPGATLTAADIKADEKKDGPSAASDTIPEPKFEGTKPVVVEADDDDDDEDDDEDENGVEAEEDESDEDISEDELAALQQDAGVEQEEEQPAAGRRARSSRTVVDYKKANDELGPDEDDE